ncbi:MAG: HAMP domain-containing protein, partial [Spirochaetales bacterium]|nr:HAMP domain-containing protein [Spirochaetales bacterium]MCF7938258.1 HAMP domain-containing protein [Spirochaetales bacterium]
RMLTEASERFQQIGEFRGLFQIVIFLLYSFFALPILLIAVLSSFLLSNEIMRPIVNLELATRKVAEGDYTYRLLTRRGDELSQLVSSFNRMLSELEHTRMQVKQTEKVAAWQEIAQRLAHEIRNPLTPIKLSAERILRKFHNGTQPVSEFLEPGLSAIIREVEGLNRMLLEFRDFAKLPEPQREDINLFEMIREAAAVYHASTTHHRIEITGPEQEIRLYADPKQLKQVFTNLIKNAMEAMPSGGTITITADLVMKGDSHYARIQVRDTGSGISEEDQESVFHPYFTSKEHGTGLGLAIVERIIFDHRGTIWFESEPGVGTTFFIDLPVEQT